MRRTFATSVFLVAALLVAAGAAAAPVVTGGGTLEIDQLLNELKLADSQPYRQDIIADDSLSTVELIQVREGLEEQSHRSHQLTLWVVRGAVRVTLGYEKHKLAAGTIVSIPPKTPYSVYSLSGATAVLVGVYSPSFNGKDRVHENSSGH